jgi:hypothetical protein
MKIIISRLAADIDITLIELRLVMEKNVKIILPILLLYSLHAAVLKHL